MPGMMFKVKGKEGRTNALMLKVIKMKRGEETIFGVVPEGIHRFTYIE
jgi:hypothetical protein